MQVSDEAICCLISVFLHQQASDWEARPGNMHTVPLSLPFRVWAGKGREASAPRLPSCGCPSPLAA